MGGDETYIRKDLTASTVEVYSSTTSQWHTADLLPQPNHVMTSVTISGCAFLLGESDLKDRPINSAFSVDMTILINKAPSNWKTLPDTPLSFSTAATLSGGLLAVGGVNDKNQAQSSVHLFVPSTNSWVKLSSGDMPVEKVYTANISLSDNRVMVMGGKDDRGRDTSTCYSGSVVI